MKITKTFISVFLVTFFIGYVSVLSTEKEKTELSKLPDSSEVSETNPKITPAPQIEKTAELETIKELTDSDMDDFSRYKIKLLETGEGFHGDEVKAKSGETWFGLFKEKDGYVFRPTKIKIRRVRDEIMDGEKDIKTGKDVFVKGKKQPIFLLKNADEILEGKIRTLFHGLSWNEAFKDEESNLPLEDMLTTLKRDFFREFEIGGKKYELKVIEAKNHNDETLSALILESGNKRQIIHTMKAGANSDMGHLYWVGDLDRDGKPDFYFDLFEHYNVMNQVLYLSSFAQKEQFISKAAYFWTTGC